VISAGLLLQAQDTFHTQVPLDTVIVESPVPAVQPFFEFFLNVPAPIQATGAIAGLLVVVAVVWYAWRRRAAVGRWLARRSHAAQLALAGALIGVAVLVAAAGVMTYDYVQHENAFCNSCHIMNEAYMRFSGSEHSELGCHDCHRQPVTTSLRQLVLWVAERPEEIPPHSPVPSGICGECHLQWEPDTLWMTEEAWRNVGATAGHIIHLESGHPDLTGMECADCHGVRVHRFIPVEATCLSSGCHEGLEIQLGRMARAPVIFHCAGCHEFTAPVEPPARGVATAAAQAISPDMEQCYSCHVMEQVLPRAHVAADPHKAACGLCHNPHTQVAVAEAAGSCATAGCHDRVEQLTPFHRGLHESVVSDCVRCHTAHVFRVDGSNCLSCHSDIYNDAGSTAARP
jgi:nitrate/TMAO reductase-like tetraheme cytochrome c subunit